MAESVANKKKNLSFKEKHTLEERLQEARKKKESNPRLVPLIVEKHHRSKLPEIEKSKFLVSGDLKFYEFQVSIKSKLKLDKTEALYFFTAAKKIDKPNALVREIYEANRDEDEFLYITYAELETFGGNN